MTKSIHSGGKEIVDKNDCPCKRTKRQNSSSSFHVPWFSGFKKSTEAGNYILRYSEPNIPILKCNVLLILYAGLEYILNERYMVFLWEKVNFQLEENSSSNHFQMTVFPLSFFKLKTMEVQQVHLKAVKTWWWKWVINFSVLTLNEVRIYWM